ncbi:MAG TPA: hypothetical protein VK816_04670 [Jatrophihabitantaceae bacterium]|jgi:hypothetical protein|nr:hypothetical protein [Jatrophihabitantaceae bacterium]
MTKQPALPFEPPARSAVSTQALCSGPIETSVFAVSGSAARPGERAHVGVKFGRVLIYLEDRAALDSLARAVGQAVDLGAAIFSPPKDAFAEVEANARRRFERTGDIAALR